MPQGAARGLSPYAIGLIMSREEESVRSPMEGIHANALQLATSEMRRAATAGDGAAFEAAYLRHLAAVLDEYLDDLVLEGVTA